MIDFIDAYNKCRELFIKQGYNGVRRVRQTDEVWIFSPDLRPFKGSSYGDLSIVYPKDGSEAFYLLADLDMIRKYIDPSTEFMNEKEIDALQEELEKVKTYDKEGSVEDDQT